MANCSSFDSITFARLLDSKRIQGFIDPSPSGIGCRKRQADVAHQKKLSFLLMLPMSP
jgi:hypothetical protein